MISQTFRFLYDSRTSKSVDPGTELADTVDGIFVVQIAVFFVEFSLCAAGKIPFYFFPNISLVVEVECRAVPTDKKVMAESLI